MPRKPWVLPQTPPAGPRPRPAVKDGRKDDPYAPAKAPPTSYNGEGRRSVPIEIIEPQTRNAGLVAVPLNEQYDRAIVEPSPWDRTSEPLTYTTGALSPRQVIEVTEQVIREAGVTNGVTVGPGLLAGLLAIALKLPLEEIDGIRGER